MSLQNKILQVLGIPYSALLSIIFCLMILSFPIGAYLVFNSEIGDYVTHEYPMNGLNVFLGGLGLEIPMKFELGDGFIMLWCIFLILFTVSIFGPKKNFLATLQSIISEGNYPIQDNHVAVIIKWFSILVIVSGSIIAIQEFFGISIVPPVGANHLIQFFDLSLAPIVEELGFRVVLIGLPLFALYSHKISFRFLIRSLWRPAQNLHIVNTKRALLVIIIVGVFFGFAHIISGEAWSAGKFAQATASGIIIGWVYFRHGLAPAILIHWAANYFIFSYAYIISDVSQITVDSAFEHSLLNTLEMMLLAIGIISVAIFTLNRLFSKRNILHT